MKSTPKHQHSHHKLLINIPAISHSKFLSTETLQSVKMRSTLSTIQNLSMLPTVTKTEPNTVRNKKTISIIKKPLKLNNNSTKYRVKKEFDKLYGLNESYYKELNSLKTEHNLSLSEYQSRLLNISSNLSRDNLLKLYTELKTIKNSIEVVKPLPPVNFKKIIEHSKKEFRRKNRIVLKGREEKDAFEVEMENFKKNSKRKLKKEDPVLIKAFSILPEYLVNVLVKKKRKNVIE